MVEGIGLFNLVERGFRGSMVFQYDTFSGFLAHDNCSHCNEGKEEISLNRLPMKAVKFSLEVFKNTLRAGLSTLDPASVQKTGVAYVLISLSVLHFYFITDTSEPYPHF